jgi:hypothetical protein
MNLEIELTDFIRQLFPDAEIKKDKSLEKVTFIDIDYKGKYVVAEINHSKGQIGISLMQENDFGSQHDAVFSDVEEAKKYLSALLVR